MEIERLAEILDQRELGDTTIGVNWSSVGPVKPRTARAFARRILALADEADARIERAHGEGCKIIDPEVTP